MQTEYILPLLALIGACAALAFVLTGRASRRTVQTRTAEEIGLLAARFVRDSEADRRRAEERASNLLRIYERAQARLDQIEPAAARASGILEELLAGAGALPPTTHNNAIARALGELHRALALPYVDAETWQRAKDIARRQGFESDQCRRSEAEEAR